MEEVEETAVWGSTDSSGGNDLVNVALVVRKGSLVSREEVVAKVAATLHPRKQITGQVKYKSKFQIFHLGKSQFRKKKKCRIIRWFSSMESRTTHRGRNFGTS